MKIGIDITSTQDNLKHRGIGVVTRFLVENLLKIGQENEYFLIGFDCPSTLDEVVGKYPQVHFEKIYGKLFPLGPFKPFYFKLLQERRLKKFNLDLFFQPNFVRGIPFKICPTVVFMHDITPYLMNYYSSRGRLINFLGKLIYQYNIGHLRAAFHINVNSMATKKDLIEHFGFKDDKITVTYLAPALFFKPASNDEVELVKIKYKIKKPYILFVGGANRNKNIEGVVKAFKKLLDKKIGDFVLVLPGGDIADFLYPEARRLDKIIKNWKLETQVLRVGHVVNKDLAVLYSGAEVLVYPSLYEGFGFCILEAMACGCPVITSNLSSMPEVAGETAVLVNPKDNYQIAEAIEEILKNKVLRNNLIKKGFKQVEKFSWEKCARETLEVFEGFGGKEI